MFGWEFPPHISGGLGTACLGLTQSLAHEDVELMFVVPRLFGDEPSNHYSLISASDVVFPFDEEHQKPEPLPKRKIRSTVFHTHTTSSESRPEKSTRQVTYIEIESSLTPYHSPEEKEISWSIEDWNYRLHPGSRYVTSESVETDEDNPEEETGYTLSFTGKYGPNLNKEVDQYAKVAARIASSYEHDVIHVHDWMTFPAGIAAKKISGRPLVVHVHATEFDRSGASNGPVSDIERSGLQQADRIIAVSEWTRNILIRHYGIEPGKISVVHNGIVAGASPGINSGNQLGSHVVTFLGRVTQQKGPGFFVEAARKVSAHFPDAHFVIAGAGDLLPQTIERVAQLRLSNRFHFTGFLNQEWISKIWSMSDVYVMPSVSEPFGITPLEAIQAGVPVIVSKQSGVAEVMPHALKVDFWDTEALAASICSVLRYKSLSSLMRKKAANEIGKLSWTRAAAKIKTLYEEIAEKV